jgi:hypothetical protein
MSFKWLVEQPAVGTDLPVRWQIQLAIRELRRGALRAVLR